MCGRGGNVCVGKEASVCERRSNVCVRGCDVCVREEE